MRGSKKKKNNQEESLKMKTGSETEKERSWIKQSQTGAAKTARTEVRPHRKMG